MIDIQSLSVGDKIRIVDSLPYDAYAVPEMRKYCGQVLTVTKIVPDPGMPDCLQWCCTCDTDPNDSQIWFWYPPAIDCIVSANVAKAKYDIDEAELLSLYCK